MATDDQTERLIKLLRGIHAALLGILALAAVVVGSYLGAAVVRPDPMASVVKELSAIQSELKLLRSGMDQDRAGRDKH
jgi:hypothetical protein